MTSYQVGALTIAEISGEGPLLSSEQDALDIVGHTYGAGIDLVAIPVSRFAPDFFTLSNRLAGLFVQKLINYQLRIAFVGDLSAEIAASNALRDFVYESNKGNHVIFVRDADELAEKLS